MRIADLLERAIAGEFINAWLADPNEVCLEPSMQSLRDGLRLYRNRSDKNWSLTDCISFNVMRERGIDKALTTDHHFEQAGFGILLK